MGKTPHSQGTVRPGGIPTADAIPLLYVLCRGAGDGALPWPSLSAHDAVLTYPLVGMADLHHCGNLGRHGVGGLTLLRL